MYVDTLRIDFLARASCPGSMVSFLAGAAVAAMLDMRGQARGAGERSGLLANSVCFVSKSVLWCSAMFCGVLRVFCGCFAVFCECFTKNSVLRCFADVLLQCFGRVLRMFFVEIF